MNDSLNILVLHRMGDPMIWRSSVRDLEFCLPDYAPEHRYIVHNASLPLPEFVKDLEFHAIILGSTFLDNRYSQRLLEKTKQSYSFVQHSNAFKIAMPQDDYDCSAVLERWLLDWNVDLVYTVCPEHWDVLYPAIASAGKIRLGYTGYVSDAVIDRWKAPKPFHSRRIDVGYRANKLPPNFGRIGLVKGIVGELFTEYARGESFTTDISTNPADTIHGDKWLDFIEDSRFILGSNSGSSLLDPEGKIRERVRRYLALHPGAAFEDVEKACFPGEDGKWSFTALSPRNIEAALLKTVQVCTPGSYSGIMNSQDHYIPFEPDGSNFKDVAAMMKDARKAERIADSCKEAFLSAKELRYSYHVREIIDRIAGGISSKNIVATNAGKMERAVRRYDDSMKRRSELFWIPRRIARRIKKLALRFGAGNFFRRGV